MRRHKILGFAGLVLFAVTFIHAQNPLDAFQQFSASVSGSPLKWNNLKVYRSGNQWRSEFAHENEIRLGNLKDKNGWYIRPLDGVKPNQCGRMTLLDMTTYPFFAYTGEDIIVERVPAAASPAEEKETVDGHSCKVENYIVKPKEGGVTIKMKLWEAEDLKGFPIKMEIEPSARPKFTMSYSDVSLEKPNLKLFQLPAICRLPGKQNSPPAAAKTPSKKTAQTPKSK